MTAPLDGVEAVDICAGLLRDWPLPLPGAGGDKEVRGHVLIIAGSREMPGALLLAATAALRAGAGKLTVATAATVAAGVALQLPEARVIGLDESAGGGLLVAGAAAGAGALRAACQQADAVLIGPGMQDDAATAALVLALLDDCAGASVILDAAAMQVVRGAAGWRFARPVLLTPHAGEMAGLTGRDKAAVAGDPQSTAMAAAHVWQAAVALKGALTVIADPGGRVWCHRGGNAGLAVSGSGDVLAGLIAGIAARGAALEQAAAWGVALHALAGQQLALKHGPLGYLAREISGEVPALLRLLAAT
jgi:hydroxyethylthiazole kinase-like uncharacterized protein yjeF